MNLMRNLFIGLIAIIFGKSPNWVATLILDGIISRLSVFIFAIPFVYFIDNGTIDNSFDNFSGTVQNHDVLNFIFSVTVSPILESLIVMLLSVFLYKNKYFNIYINGIIVGILFVPLHGLSFLSFFVIPTFALQSIVITNWTMNGKQIQGFWLIYGMHAFANATAYLLNILSLEYYLPL